MKLLLLVAGCGPDLAKLETEERALAEEVAVLRENVADMRARMQEMGLVPARPKGVAAAAPEAQNDLSAQLPVEITRAGDPPTFEPLGAPERRDNTECGYRFAATWLEALSDTTLEQAGAGKASPIVLLQDGRPLTAHAGPHAFEKGCRFGFRHAPKFLFLSPEGAVDAITGEWTLALSPEVPMPRGGDGAPVYWVYPGTTLTVSFGAGWDEAWGELQVDLQAQLVWVGTPEAPRATPASPATVSFLTFEQSGKDVVFGVSHRPEQRPEGPWTLEVSSPADGPYVLLQSLTVGNATNARSVLTTTPQGGADE